MKATGIVRRIDDLGRVVIPKEIRRTMRLRDGDPSLKSLTQDLVFCMGIEAAKERYIGMKTRQTGAAACGQLLFYYALYLNLFH